MQTVFIGAQAPSERDGWAVRNFGDMLEAPDPSLGAGSLDCLFGLMFKRKFPFHSYLLYSEDTPSLDAGKASGWQPPPHKNCIVRERRGQVAVQRSCLYKKWQNRSSKNSKKKVK